MVVKKHLTDRALKALKPAAEGGRYIAYDSQVPGFGIRVGDTVSTLRIGSFVLVARFPGSSNTVPRRIGDYPAMTLADARQIAREWREDLSKGVDPKQKEIERQRQEQARREDTFQAAFNTYARVHLSRLRTGKVVEQAMRRVVLPRFGGWPLTDLRRRHVLDLIQGLAIETPIGANRILAYLKAFLTWCVDTDRIEISPVAGVKRPTSEKERARERVLSDSEIRAIWRACGSAGSFGRAIRFLLVTGQRRGEVGGMRWGEVDPANEIWRLSGARTKAKRAHEIPLSALALGILDACPRVGESEFVFTTGRAPKGSAAHAGGMPSGWSKAKGRMDRLAFGEDVPEWRLHDLRRTVATNLAKLGVDRVVVALILNHAPREITAVYDRHRYDAEKRQALDLWANRLRSIVEDVGDNAVSLHAVAERS